MTVTIYDNVWNCQANDNSKYRIYTGNSDQCINVWDVPPSDAECSLYTDGGFGGPVACPKDYNFLGDSVFFNDLHTQVAGTNDCWSCEFFSASNCEVPVYNGVSNLKCQSWGGDGIWSFKCVCQFPTFLLPLVFLVPRVVNLLMTPV